MKLYSLFTKIMVMIFCSGFTQAQSGPGWVSAERPTPEQAKAYFEKAGLNTPAIIPNLNQPSVENIVTEAEASASLAKRTTVGGASLRTSALSNSTTTNALLNAPTPTAGGNSADFITPEIQNLAAGLSYDPTKIYEYVRNYIDYEDYFGSKKGAHLTLLEGSGNSFDQSALLVALLRASGHAPQYKYGAALFTYTQLTKWMGLDPTPFSHLTNAQFLSQNLLPSTTPVADIPGLKRKFAIFYFFDAHGYFYFDPFDISATETAVALPQVWVSLTVDGTSYDNLSPAWKDYTNSNNINLATAMAYSRTNFLTQAGGTISTPDAVSGLNYTAISNTLTGYTTALTNHLKTGESYREANRITGSRSISQISVSSLSATRIIFPSTFSSDWLPGETWTAIPDIHFSKVQIQLGQGWNATSKTFATPLPSTTLRMTELRGRKLSLSFIGNSARIQLDETLVGTAATVTAASVEMRLSITHNHYRLTYQSNGTYTVGSNTKSNQEEVKTYLKANNYAYAIIYSFGNPENHLRKREEVLDGYRLANIADSDWRVITEVLNVMGLNWMYQTYLQEQVLAPLYQTIPMQHHRFGRASQESSYYVDIGLQFSGNQNRISNEQENTQLLSLSGFFASAMEHSVIEQLQGPNQNAVSTVKLLYLANQIGQKVYRTTGANWAAINTAANLQNYDAATKATIQTAVVTNGGIALIPQNAQVTLNQWRGIGYALQGEAKIAMLIGGNLFGGYNSNPASLNSTIAAMAVTSNPSYNHGPKTGPRSPYEPLTTPRYASKDPVDMASGAFFLDKSEISIGEGSSPRGIGFTRQYNSNRRFDKSAGLGYGWTHNYQMTVTKRSSVKSSLGESISYHAVPFYVAALVASDLYRNQANAKEWATASLVTQWFSDQLRYNAVAISMGNKTMEFVKMPDGTYEAPANMNLALTSSGSGAAETFIMTERHGSTYTFNAAGRIATITDLWGKVMSFGYTGSLLTTITDGYNRSLGLTWVGNKITSLADTNSRSVGFSYTGDDLTTCTDVEGKAWRYVYDPSHRITDTLDPSNRTIARNVYNSDSRVTEQYTFGLTPNRYDLTYTGFCNIEQNPLGGRTCYLYDERGRGIGTVDPLANETTMIYDGHDRITASATPESEISDQYFDRYNNLVLAIDPIGEASIMSYDSTQRLLTSTDKRGNVTTVNSYSAQHQPLQITAPLGRVMTHTYTSTGESDIVTDPAGNTTDSDYNPLGQLITTKVNNIITAQFTYNSYGDLATSTDALGQVTTLTYNKRRQLLRSTAQAIAGQAASVITNTYDNEGLLLSTADPRGNLTSMTYSATGDPVTTTFPVINSTAGPLNNVITNSYDLRDWMTGSSNSLNHTQSMGYDAAHRMTSSTDPLSRTTETAYDKNARPKQVTDSLSRVSKTSYSRRSEPLIATDPLNQNTARLYDPNGNCTRITNRRNKPHNFVFDAANRQTTSTTPTGKATITSYRLNDQVNSITEPSGQVTNYTYDTRLRVQTKTDPVSAITYGYDLVNNLKTVTESGSLISRNYDARNRLISYTNADGEIIQYQYDANNNLTRLTYPDGKQVNYTYNARNHMTSVTDWASRVTNYQYDRIGRLVGITRPNSTTGTMAYDAASQLTWKKENSPGRIFSYLSFQYDLAGQITKKLRAPLVNSGWQQPTFTATYDDDNRLATVNGTAINHDADGNMTNGPISRSAGVPPVSITLTYNSRNQLTNAAGLSYTYDAEGRRRTLTDTSGTTRDTIDPSGQLLVRTAPGGVKTYYVYGLGLLYEANATGQTKTYHFDQVGSTIARTDDAGKVIGQADYSAYGITFWQRGDMNTPFLYNGQAGVQTDANGLLNMRARYYSPYLMRFLNADPSGFSGGSNWFAYADGNPVSLSDPFGLCAEGGGGMWNSAKNGLNSALNYTWGDMGNQIVSFTQSIGAQNPWLVDTIDAVNYNMPLEALGPNPGMFFTGGGQAISYLSGLTRGLTAAKGGATLPADIAASFRGGNYGSRVLQSDVEALRFSGGISAPEGRFLTTSQTATGIATPQEAIQALNLPSGATAQQLNTFTIPQGTRIFYGRVEGGWQHATQIFIENPSVLKPAP